VRVFCFEYTKWRQDFKSFKFGKSDGGGDPKWVAVNAMYTVCKMCVRCFFCLCKLRSYL